MMADLLDEGRRPISTSNAFHDRLERHAIQMTFGTSRDHFRGSLRMLKDNRDEPSIC